MRLIDADSLKLKIIAEDDGKWMISSHFISDIDSAPTIEERKTGMWEVVDIYNYNGGTTVCVCNQCRDFYTVDADEMNYCPHCGAQMEGASDE